MKFIFRKKFLNGKRVIYFCGIKIWTYTKKRENDPQKIFNYLSKYKYALENIPHSEIIEGYQDCIWQLWLQGEDNAPAIVKKCINSVRHYCQENNKKHIILTEENIFDYIEAPDFLLEKYKKGIYSKTHFSDYIRLALLAKYGGTWIDATVLLTGPIPEKIFQQNFFHFKTLPWLNIDAQRIPSEAQLHILDEIYPKNNVYITGSSWFIHTKPDNILITATKKIFEEYWKNENILIDYFLFHYIVTFAAINNNEAGKELGNSLSVWNGDKIIHAAMERLTKTYMTKEEFNTIKALYPIHKLSYKNQPQYKTDGTFFDFFMNNK